MDEHLVVFEYPHALSQRAPLLGSGLYILKEEGGERRQIYLGDVVDREQSGKDSVKVTVRLVRGVHVHEQ